MRVPRGVAQRARLRGPQVLRPQALPPEQQPPQAEELPLVPQRELPRLVPEQAPREPQQVPRVRAPPVRAPPVRVLGQAALPARGPAPKPCPSRAMPRLALRSRAES